MNRFGSRFIIIGIVFVLISPQIQAQRLIDPVDEFPETFQEAIRLFPANLQGGFSAMHTVATAHGTSSSEFLNVLQLAYFSHWLRVTYIDQGRGSELMSDGQTTASSLYLQMRNNTIMVVGGIMQMVVISGNPGGTNWGVWERHLLAWI